MYSTVPVEAMVRGGKLIPVRDAYLLLTDDTRDYNFCNP